MTLRKLIAPVSLLTLVCLILTNAIDLPTARAASNTVVISEFRVRGPNGAADEFVELYNLSASTVDISGWLLKGSNNAGTVSTRATIPAGTSIGAGCHYLITNSSASGGPYSGTVPGNLTYTTGITDDGGIALMTGASVIVDQAGMSAGSAYKEGTQLASLGSSNTNRGYERKPGGASGSGQDTDNNASDFQVKQPSDPQNLSSPCIGVSTGFTATGAATPSTVDPGGATLLSVTVLPNTTTGVTVTADLTPVGGSTNTSFYDDGTHGDLTAGDNVFSLGYTIPTNSGTGTKTINATAKDAGNNTAPATISVTVNPPQLTIMQIQGSGSRSPHEGQTVKTTGVVYDVRNNGFWIQDPNGDGDPMTSDGVFVYTGSAPTVHQGDGASVSGLVAEFAASGDPSAAPQTELSGPTVAVLTTGNPLPTPVTITAADLDPNGGIDQLERYEGMRVHVDTLNVVAPTAGTVTESSATAVTNGVFFGVIPALPRAFRKAGIELPAAAPAGSPCCIPFWNGGPQRIRVDTRTLSSALDLTTGAVVSGLTGPLDFSQHAYTIVTETTPMIVSGNVSAVPVPTPDDTEFTVASFNMQRFFDTSDDPNTSDAVLTQTAFNNRLNKASLAIRNVMMMPDIIGVEEMENLTTLQAVANKVNTDAATAGQPNPEYSAYLVEGNDVGGIDVGLLVKSRITVNSVTQYGKDTTFVEPGGTVAILNDRPPLALSASITKNGKTIPFIMIVVHQRSLSSVDDPVDGPRVREKRRQQAEYLANLIQASQTADPNAKIVTVGDFNAFEVNDGYVDPMGTVEGNPTTADQVVLASPDLVDPNLTDLESTLPADQQYSYVNYGTAQTLDHIIVSQGMLGIFNRFTYARNGADYPETFRNDPNRPERISDHDMEVAYFHLNRVPSVNEAQTFTLGAGQVNVVGTTTGSDPDGDTLTNWQITGGDGAAYFAINPTTGQITVPNPGALDTDRTTPYSLSVTVSDGYISSTATVVAINPAPIVAGSVQLITTATITKLGDGSYQATVKVFNRGTGTARNVQLTGATLGAASGSAVPQSLVNIPPMGFAITTVNFPTGAGASGAMVIERYNGTYSGGTFVGSIRAVLP
jgi:predicted extracellular nuclease